MRSVFWPKGVFNLVIAGCIAFVLLTLVAMFFYPGGTFSDVNSRGYSFFGNFFSELGMARTHNGGEKTVSLVLFVIAMVLVGSGMVLFFVAFPGFFRSTRTGRILGTAGSALGILSALCFIGVAAFPLHGATPAEVLQAADEALYRAKKAGRNRVEIAPPKESATVAIDAARA